MTPDDPPRPPAWNVKVLRYCDLRWAAHAVPM